MLHQPDWLRFFSFIGLLFAVPIAASLLSFAYDRDPIYDGAAALSLLIGVAPFLLSAD